MSSFDRLARRRLMGMTACLAPTLLAACQLPGQGPPPRTFSLSPKTTFDELPEVDWTLAVDRPTADRAVDTTRIARRDGVEIEYYANATWVDRPANMIQPLLIQSFLSSGAIKVVVDRRSDIRPDFMLQTDITAFFALPAESAAPEVRVVMAATLLRMPQRDVAGTTEIGRTVPATSGDLPAIATAFDDALGKVFKRLVEWTILTGEAARRSS
jgi:cholesterol transport system auxiliary component